VPATYRTRLIKSYRQLKAAYSEEQYDACGLRAGRFCEVILRYLQSTLTGSATPFGSHITNFSDECRKLERVPQAAGSESFRLLIPRALNYLYSLRNKRGIGHVGGDVEANRIDASACLNIADWCVCEIIRVVHTLSLEEAQDLLDALSTRTVPEVWSVLGKKRVLDASLDYAAKTLLLLYAEPTAAVAAEDLFQWTEHSTFAVYRRDVLRRLHALRLLEYDLETEMVVISPLGIKRVEETLLKRRSGRGA
jgi:hypothetical protein